MILAIDLGLRHTGWATEHESGSIHAPARYSKGIMKQRRLRWWAAALQTLIREQEPSVVYVEAPFIHARNSSGMVEVTKLHGVLDVASPVDVIPVSNQSIKSWVSRHKPTYISWPYDKDDMLTFARTEYDFDEPLDDYDRADAFLLLMMQLHPKE